MEDIHDHLDHLHQLLRTQILRGVVTAVDDTGASQMLTVRTHYGIVRAQVELAQPFGLASHVPLDGAVVHVLANGGDPSDLVALAAHNPSVARMGDLAEGETVLYDQLGQAVWLRGGVIVQVDAARQMVVRVGGEPVLTVTASGVQVQGTITATEDVVAGQISVQSHLHGGVQQGGDLTGKPQA